MTGSVEGQATPEVGSDDWVVEDRRTKKSAGKSGVCKSLLQDHGVRLVRQAQTCLRGDADIQQTG